MGDGISNIKTFLSTLADHPVFGRSSGQMQGKPTKLEASSGNGLKTPSRPRALPYRGAFIRATVFSAICYLAMVAAATSIILFALYPSMLARNAIVISLAIGALAWLLAFSARRSAFCPLCKGTPLLDTGARPHDKAVRVRPLSHGVTAILSILSTQQFRCMYCGSHFDLLKPPAHRRKGHSPPETADRNAGEPPDGREGA